MSSPAAVVGHPPGLIRRADTVVRVFRAEPAVAVWNAGVRRGKRQGAFRWAPSGRDRYQSYWKDTEWGLPHPRLTATSTPLQVGTAPSDAVAVTTSSVAAVGRPPGLTEQARKRAQLLNDRRARARAAESKRMRQPVNLKLPFLTYCRPSTFDNGRISAGHPTVYTDNEMASFDATVEKQMHFSFSARRDSAKKAASTARASRSSVLDLDHDLGAHTVSTTDFRDLSRYLMEDLVRSAAGDRFLVCVDKQADFAGVPARIALHQRKEKVGGELVRISGRVYFTLAGTLTLANSNQSVQLGMTRGQFLREYTSHGAGFGLSFDASPDTLTFSWQDIVEQPLDVMFFGRKFEGG